jgi:hypothetical protein
VLDDVLVEQLLKINRFRFRGKEYPFNLEDAHEALRRLKPTPDKLKGLRGTNQDIYDQLILGTTITKAIEGDSKSYSFRYVGRLPSPRMRATATLRLWDGRLPLSATIVAGRRRKKCRLVYSQLILANTRSTSTASTAMA